MPSKNHNIRKLTSVGRGASISVVIPADIIDELGWRARQKVVAKRYGKGVIFTDWKPKASTKSTSQKLKVKS